MIRKFWIPTSGVRGQCADGKQSSDESLQAMCGPAPVWARRAQTSFLIKLFTWVGKTVRVCIKLLCFGGGRLKRRLAPERSFTMIGFRAFAGTTGALTGKSCAGYGKLGTELEPLVPMSFRVTGPESAVLLL